MPSTGTPSAQTAAGAAGAFFLGDGLGAAGEDDAARAEGADVGAAGIPGMDLAVDAELAHATGDQLGVLRTEIEDQDAVGVDVTGLRQARGRGIGAHETR